MSTKHHNPLRIYAWPLILAVIGLLIFAYALFNAATASADTTDDVFIKTLDDQGITYPTVPYAINAGHAICTVRESGYTELRTAAAVSQYSGMGSYNAGFFVGAAEMAYCPWYYNSGKVV